MSQINEVADLIKIRKIAKSWLALLILQDYGGSACFCFFNLFISFFFCENIFESIKKSGLAEGCQNDNLLISY